MKIYGLFECSSCGRTWTSLKAEEGVTQECNDCHDNVRPQKAMFGRFKCGCGNVWRSRRAVKESAQECRECTQDVEPSHLQEVRLKQFYINWSISLAAVITLVVLLYRKAFKKHKVAILT